MTGLTIFFLCWTLVCTWAMAILVGCKVGLRSGCKIWAPDDSYEELYGPVGTFCLSWTERVLFKLLGPK